MSITERRRLHTSGLSPSAAPFRSVPEAVRRCSVSLRPSSSASVLLVFAAASFPRPWSRMPIPLRAAAVERLSSGSRGVAFKVRVGGPGMRLAVIRPQPRDPPCLLHCLQLERGRQPFPLTCLPRPWPQLPRLFPHPSPVLETADSQQTTTAATTTRDKRRIRCANSIDVETTSPSSESLARRPANTGALGIRADQLASTQHDLDLRLSHRLPVFPFCHCSDPTPDRFLLAAGFKRRNLDRSAN